MRFYGRALKFTGINEIPVGFASGMHFIPKAIDVIQNRGRPFAFLRSLNFGLIKAEIRGACTK